VSRERLDGLFSARQLVEMASSVPARVARIDDKVGTIAPGMLADFFIVHSTEHQAKHSVISNCACWRLMPA
jgi:N-acetylglucosamine-6-phosphate deacetylase